MNTDDLALIVAAIVGGGSLLFSGFQAWLNHKERTAGYRSALYAAQIEAHAEVVREATLIRAAFLNLIRWRRGTWIVDPEEQEPDDLARASYEKMRTHNAHWETILPKRSLAALRDFRGTIATIAASLVPSGEQLHANMLQNNPEVTIERAFENLIGTVRNEMGSDELSENTADLIGVDHPEVPENPE